MNRKLKVLAIIILTIFGIFCISHVTFAAKGKALVTGSFTGASEKAVSTSDGETLITKIIGPVLSVIRIVAIGIGVIMITFLGIKYMSAAPSEKASIKNQLVTFTIGFAIVVAATTILDMAHTAVSNITK